MYSIITQAMPIGKYLSSHVTNVFLNSCIDRQDISSYVLADRKLQIRSTLFVTLCNMPVKKHLTKTAYHPQLKWQVKQYKFTVLTQLPYYFAKTQKNWDRCVQPLAKYQSAQVHKFTKRIHLVLYCRNTRLGQHRVFNRAH